MSNQPLIGTDVLLAAQYLRDGKLVGIPTETVYGLAANALNEDALLKIFEAKQRPKFNPLIVHVASVQELNKYVSDLPVKAKLVAEQLMPGPITLLLAKKDSVPDLATAGSNKVAIRIPNHPLT
jgi:L-threonylcarbamoyladenylate synthase